MPGILMLGIEIQGIKMLESIEVAADDSGLPVTLTRRKRRCRVKGVVERWRVADEWWADEVQRDYFRVETDVGRVLDIYHDMLADRWYLSGMR